MDCRKDCVQLATQKERAAQGKLRKREDENGRWWLQKLVHNAFDKTAAPKLMDKIETGFISDVRSAAGDLVQHEIMELYTDTDFLRTSRLWRSYGIFISVSKSDEWTSGYAVYEIVGSDDVVLIEEVIA